MTKPARAKKQTVTVCARCRLKRMRPENTQDLGLPSFGSFASPVSKKDMDTLITDIGYTYISAVTHENDTTTFEGGSPHSTYHCSELNSTQYCGNRP